MGVNGHWYVEIEKQAYWRGSPHTWVNRYVMSGAQPSASDALTVISALKTIENNLYPNTAGGIGLGFVQGRAYPSGKGTYFANVDYNVSLAAATATGFSGGMFLNYEPSWAPTLETCLLVETPITGLSSTGKPISLRKFIRGVNIGPDEADGTGAIPDAARTVVANLTAGWSTGVGSNNYVVIANSGSQSSGPPTAHPFLVAHQIPRGRKKKKSGTSVLDFLASEAAKGAISAAGAAAVEALL